MQTVLRCHMEAFAAIGGVPNEILYDRMKTAVIGEAGGSIVYNRALVDFARHYGYQPKACRPYRAKTKGKVERPYPYIREDFFLARSFRNLDDLNAQLGYWLDTVANPRVHAATQRVVNEAFAEEKPHLKTLPLAPFRSVLKLERRVSHEGMVSVGGNLYSVPDATRKRVIEVHTLADEVRIFEDGALIAAHPVLEGRHQRRVAAGHRKMPRITNPRRDKPIMILRTGDVVAARPLDFYQAVGRRLAYQGDEHERDYRNRTVRARPHPQNSGRLKDAQGPGGLGPGRAPARARRRLPLFIGCVAAFHYAFLEKNLIRTGLLEMAMRWSPNLSRHRSHAKRNARPDRRFSSIRMAQRRRRCTNTMDGFWWLIKLDVVIHNTTIRS